MKVSASVYTKGYQGKFEAYASQDLEADEDIDEYVEDLRSFLKETLQYIQEEVA